LAAALTSEIRRLEESRTLLLQIEHGGLLVADDAGWLRTANLLAWGAEPVEIGVLVEASAGDATTYLQGSALFTSLVKWGLPREESLALAAAAENSELEPDDYPGIFEILLQSRRLRISPEEAAERLTRGLATAENLRQLRKGVLK
jgi:hypothetical protein